jgi:hypothetical protein
LPRSPPPDAAIAQIQLVPVATGLQIRVRTGARDGTRGLFIVEQAGVIRVMPLAATAWRRFSTSDLACCRRRTRAARVSRSIRHTRATAASSSTNTTRRDGAIVIAEYQASSGNRDPPIQPSAWC